jgi:hypothetical protein
VRDQAVERSFIADFSWRGRRTLGLAHLPNGDVKWAFDHPADPKPIDWIEICRRVSADADQRRARARAEWKKRRRRAAAEADRTTLSEAQFQTKLSEANRAKLGEAVDAYMAREPQLGVEDVMTLLMLLSSEEATEAFAYLDLPTDETLTLINDCVKARQFANGERKTRATSDRERRLRAISRRGDKAAARSRAIGWLKSSVLRLSGRPSIKRVAALCSAVLGANISEAAVKRARTQEELLDRRGIPFGMSIDGQQCFFAPAKSPD